jgi:hypothetical protein
MRAEFPGPEISFRPVGQLDEQILFRPNRNAKLLGLFGFRSRIFADDN